VIEYLNFGPGMCAVLGGQIQIMPGASCEVVAGQQLLALSGVLTFAGETGLSGFTLQLLPGGSGVVGLGISFITLQGVANLLKITLPSNGQPGTVQVPPTVAWRWNGAYPPGPGSCSNLALVPARSLPVAA
jgi:hypothetical protein